MTDTNVKFPKKLIEVALPLDAINAACVREKAIRHGHPSTLHLWWARRPLAAARAVIFASMVNDPGYEVGSGFRHGVNKVEAERKRKELFQIIEDLVKWENSNNPEVLERARNAIMESWRETCKYNAKHPRAKELFNPEKLPAFHDPFAGGGALPLEAQRLGLESYASDLNPVPVLINKAMIEIPPRFHNSRPVGPLPKGGKTNLTYNGPEGLAEDISRYGLWLLDEAKKRIGQYYPEVVITEELAKDRPDLQDLIGKSFPVIAYVWARTVKSPSPLHSHVDVPLASTFILSKKKGGEAYIDVDVQKEKISFSVKRGGIPDKAKAGTKITRGAFSCLISGMPISYEYIDCQANTQGLGQVLMAVVLDGPKGRIYISPSDEQECLPKLGKPSWKPMLPCKGTFASNALGRRYGFKSFSDYFSNRQLIALSTFGDLIPTVIAKAKDDAVVAGMVDDDIPLAQGGQGGRAYAEAIGLYLSFAIDKMADRGSTICGWDTSRDGIRNTFGRQAIPMTWDYAEANPFSPASGSFKNMLEWVYKAVLNLPCSKTGGHVEQADARTQQISSDKLISTDPPYYDNIGYADLSDFFYVWLRKNAKSIYPEICATFATPKEDELIATPYRHENKKAAEEFFLHGMTEVMAGLNTQSHPAFPVTIYYAFKQSETKEGATSNTGWVTFLEAVLRAGFVITGTWPMRTELGNRMISYGSNALASSIVLVCRRRPENAETVDRRTFIRALKERLSVAMDEMVDGIAPVDMSQAIIGPGMEVFSQYNAVIENDGSKMSVDTALRIINKFLDDGDGFDADTQFCIHWYKEFAWSEGSYGKADDLARSKNVGVNGLAESGVISSGKGKVRLLTWDELPADWDPASDKRLSVWEACHHLIRALQTGGVEEAGRLLSRMMSFSGNVQLFCANMYVYCERAKIVDDARLYNALSVAWPDIQAAADVKSKENIIPEQTELEF